MTTPNVEYHPAQFKPANIRRLQKLTGCRAVVIAGQGLKWVPDIPGKACKHD